MLGDAASVVREEAHVRCALRERRPASDPRGPRRRRRAPARRGQPSRSRRARCSGSPRSRARARSTSSTSSPATDAAERGELLIDGRAHAAPHHPFDVIRKGVVLVPADRLHALLPQRSIRENIAAPLFNRVARWGPINGRESARECTASGRPALDRHTAARPRCDGSRAATSRRSRSPAGSHRGLRVMLLFDPTRGIDVGTKHQVYDLIGQLADEGAAVVMFTSELREIGLVCDRAACSTTAGGSWPSCRRRQRVGAADAAHGLDAEMAARAHERSRPAAAFDSGTHQYDSAGHADRSASPVALAVAARGLDTRRGPAVRAAARVADLPGAPVRPLRGAHDHRRHDAPRLPRHGPEHHRDLRRHRPVRRRPMVFANCLSALWMEGHGSGACLGIAGRRARRQRRCSCTRSAGHHRVRRSRHHRHARRQLHRSRASPCSCIGSTGRRQSHRLPALRRRPGLDNFWPSVLWTIGALVLVWLPLRLSRTGLAIYATGSNRNAAFLSGVSTRPQPGSRPTPSVACSPASPAW